MEHCATDFTLIWTIVGTGIGSVISIVGINIALFNWLKGDISSQGEKITSLEERMFLLSTGKTLSQAILEEKMKEKKRKEKLE